MKRFLSRLVASLKGSRRSNRPLAESHRVRPGLEDLEGRQMMSASPLPSLAALSANLHARLAHCATATTVHSAGRSAPASKAFVQIIDVEHGEKLPPGMIIKPVQSAPAGKARFQFIDLRDSPSQSDTLKGTIRVVKFMGEDIITLKLDGRTVATRLDFQSDEMRTIVAKLDGHKIVVTGYTPLQSFAIFQGQPYHGTFEVTGFKDVSR